MMIFVLALAIVGMAYDPVKNYLSFGNYTDLYRIFNELGFFRTYGWHVDENLMGLTTMTTNYNAVILAKCYMYLFATLSSNNHLIVFVNTLLTYGAIALSISLLGKKIKATNLSELSIFVFFVLINDYSRVIANIRMPLATALFALLWSFEISHNIKKNGFTHYILRFVSFIMRCFFFYDEIISRFTFRTFIEDFSSNNVIEFNVIKPDYFNTFSFQWPGSSCEWFITKSFALL
jgi:hypothetical protein